MTSNSAEMPFLEHLAELRKRLIQCVIGLSVATLFTYQYADVLFGWLTIPIRESFAQLELIGTGPAEAFIAKLKVGVAAGIVLSIPYSFYQLWLFVAPGLHEHEKRFALPFVAVSTVFFLSGILFCFKVVLPVAFAYFSDEFLSVGVHPSIRIGEYFGFVVKMCLVFGVVFELPIVAYFLARMKLLSHKALLSRFRYSLVGIFIIAGILTPPDVISQCLLAGPLLIIYALCIGVTYYAHPDEVAKRKGTPPPASGPPAPVQPS
ncbi:MAG: twin-arginine translocase subunit TatC [Bdellovibrionota bacterium]